MRVLLGLVRVGVVALLGASAWYGFIAGGRRWGPCTDSFDTPACLVAQTHETQHVPELGYPEGVSLLLLGAAMLLLAQLGGMPRGWRVAALTVGPVYALVGIVDLRSVGRTVVPGPAEPSLLDPLFALAVFAAPGVMVAVGALLLSGSAQAEGHSWRHPERPLALAWFVMAAGWPISEFFLLSLVYASHDAPPGTGMLRSAMAAIAAALVLWHLTLLRRRTEPHAASATPPAPSAAATREA